MFGDEIFDKISKARSFKKKKIDKLDFIKIKNFGSEKVLKEWKR